MIGPVYFVTDPQAPRPVTEQAMAAARGGARVVQLRDKHADDATLTRTAQALKAALAPLGVALVVNDRIRVARAAAADGLHIGQSDGDPAAARAAIGPDTMLGLSIETAGQLDAVPPGTVDYLGVGPVRATATKPDHATPLGFDGLADIVARAPCPCVAIGGLGPGDAAAVRGAGAAGLAVVSAIARAADPEAAARALDMEWRQA
ncbi:thiamine phosphate synthase [Roseovarius salinarum]|uniref:thiamine phosphate synthase n=1 Tax=Roseovarius salinarum TaxID=1981892 RepID=UPI000C34CE6E|nr:thiamine phosphate synthase [Roseovarius salinarum]